MSSFDGSVHAFVVVSALGVETRLISNDMMAVTVDAALFVIGRIETAQVSLLASSPAVAGHGAEIHKRLFIHDEVAFNITLRCYVKHVDK